MRLTSNSKVQGYFFEGGIPDFVFDNIDSIHTIRTTLKISLQTIAYACGMHPQTVSLWERGRALPNKKTYNKLAKFFDWEIWE